MPDADLALAIPAVLFGAVGTAGQRCTTTRRLYVHRSIAPEFLERLQRGYESVTGLMGDPLIPGTLMGPLHTSSAVKMYTEAAELLRSSGANILAGGKPLMAEGVLQDGNWVLPTLSVPPKPEPSAMPEIWTKETFAPILNVAVFDEIEQAIEWNNSVPQGLSSSLWTRDMRNVGKWIGPSGSDTGIVNVSLNWLEAT
jgi:aldehyde dehydrogenase family 7 protein A1